MSAYTSTAYIDFSTGYVVASEQGSNTWTGKSSWGSMAWGNDYHNPMIYYTEPIDVGNNRPYNLSINSKANGSISYRVLECSTNSFITTYDRVKLEPLAVGTVSTSTGTVKYGTASVSFPGNTSSYITVNDTANTFSTSTFTFEAWVYVTGNPSTSSDRMVYYSKRDNANNGIELFSFGSAAGPLTNSYNIAVRVNDGSAGSGGWTLAYYPITTSTWHHVALTVNASKEYRGYVNGHCYGLITGTQNLFLSTTTAYIGGKEDGTIIGAPAYFKGFMDDIRISNTCLYEGAFDTDVFTPPASATTSTLTTALLIKGDQGIVDSPNILEEVTETQINDGDTGVSAFTKRYVMVGIEVDSAERGTIYSNEIRPNQNRLNILLNDVDMTTLSNSTTTSTTKVLDLGRETSGILAVFPQKTSGLDDVGINPVVVNKSALEVSFVKATEGAQDYVYGGTASVAVDPSTMTSPVIDVMVHALPEQFMENGILQSR